MSAKAFNIEIDELKPPQDYDEWASTLLQITGGKHHIVTFNHIDILNYPEINGYLLIVDMPFYAFEELDFHSLFEGKTSLWLTYGKAPDNFNNLDPNHHVKLKRIVIGSPPPNSVEFNHNNGRCLVSFKVYKDSVKVLNSSLYEKEGN